MKCPCIVRVPAPGTWPSVLETVPETLTVVCQSYALFWLLYQQQSAEDIIMALSVHLFKPRFGCAWLGELSYVNVLDQHGDITAIPDAMEVRAVRAKECFCSNNTHNGPGMSMRIAECDGYMMDMGKNKDTSTLHKVTFYTQNHKWYDFDGKKNLIKNQVLLGNDYRQFQ